MHKILDEKANDLNIVELTDGPFMGCQLTYGQVELKDGGLLEFEYNIVNEFEVDESRKEEFLTAMGDTLISIIEQSMVAGDALYVGGNDNGATVIDYDPDLK